MAKTARKKTNPPQQQRRPGSEEKMHPKPVADKEIPQGQPRLANKIALITGADSGIGRAVAILFAKEGADIVVGYLSETKDAEETKAKVEYYGRRCLLVKGDVSKESFCRNLVQRAVRVFGRIDILVNNAAIHYETEDAAAIDTKKMQHTFAVNIFSMFYIVKYALPHMKKGSAIINTSSVTAYRGSPHLLDYSATKGAIVAYTRSLAGSLVKKGIRVNGVAPGPIWTPLIPSSFNKKRVASHGSQVPMERPGEPAEVAPAYLFLASDDASYITGQFIHPNGGEIVNA